MIEKSHTDRRSSGRYQQVHLLYRFPLRLTTNALNAGLVVAVAWGSHAHPLLLLWLVLMCGVTAVRYGQGWRFMRRQPADLEILRWRRRFTLWAAVTGTLWGVASAVLWLTPEIAYHVFIAFVIAGMSAAAVATSYSHLPSVYAFILPAVVPLAVGFLFQSGTLHLAMGVMCALYLAFLLAHARISNAVLLKSLRLQDENRALIADLSAARDRLEDRVRDRTSELESINCALQEEMEAHAETERRLQRAQKLEAVGQLTGGVAHDFNNLLAIIRGNAEFLLEEPGRNSEPAQTILHAALRGAELTQRLLAFSRRQPLRPQPVDLKALVDSLSDLAKRTLGEAIEMKTTVDPDLWNARADPGQVENALLNLAINARDAMPKGGKLSIDCRNARLDEAYAAKVPEAHAGDYVELAVSDSGVGMSAEVLEHAFEPFFTSKGLGQGNGLGLSMVYGFAQQSGGHVAIHSELGEGTTVKLYLPRDRTLAPRAKPSTTVTDPTGGGEQLLVIEDDPDLRKLAVRMLESLAYRVVGVADAASARALLASEQNIDLVLSDVVLSGGVSGPDFGQELKASFPKVKLLYMSGYPAEATALECVLDPNQQLLTKPFHRAQLAEAVRSALVSTTNDG